MTSPPPPPSAPAIHVATVISSLSGQRTVVVDASPPRPRSMSPMTGIASTRALAIDRTRPCSSSPIRRHFNTRHTYY